MPVASADAAGVTEAIQKGLQTVSINETVIEKKLACCNFDGASVMMGQKSGKMTKRHSRTTCLYHPLCGTQPGVGCVGCN